MTSPRHVLIMAAVVCLLGPPATALAQWQVDGAPVCVGTWSKQRPAMISDGNGGVIVVWEDSRTATQRIYAQRLDASGARLWGSSGIALDLTRPYTQQVPVLVPDKFGGAIVAWTEYVGPNTTIVAERVRADGTQLWSTTVCSAVGDRRALSIVSDGVEPIIMGAEGLRKQGTVMLRKVAV